ncbi:hypothetical protein NDU88_005393 [Pleurodeles waltl]|uniref:Uncharacterized protein n=1 Tax=Pleurodeles waltl TaxID=8319 RepID=A0AAV7SLK1_PLEWA|nr:hypothetical protein NDU88_005393 [Pleurodeles waltl]
MGTIFSLATKSAGCCSADREERQQRWIFVEAVSKRGNFRRDPVEQLFDLVWRLHMVIISIPRQGNGKDRHVGVLLSNSGKPPLKVLGNGKNRRV